VCDDYAAIVCPVYAVGGFADGYTNAVPRLLAGLTVPRKGLVGPWAHAFPDDAVPGPSIGFLQEALRWWDHWLKGIDTGVMDEPMLRVWMQEAVEPRPAYPERLGRWVAEDSWPSVGVELVRRELPVKGQQAIRGVQSAGAEAGVWCSDGQSADLPADQRLDDAFSLVFDLDPLAQHVELLGFPEVFLELASDRPQALVCVRLCEVAADGSSALVARGLLNLTHRESHEAPSPLEPGRRYEVRIPLDFTGQAVPAGHRLRVAVSPTYWPWAWPSPEPVTLTVFAAALELPVRAPRPEGAELAPFGDPEHAPPLEVEAVASRPAGRYLSRDLATGLVEQVFDWDLGGAQRLVLIDLLSEDSNHTVYSIVEGDPLSARVEFRASTGMARGDWRARAEVESTMSADSESFYVTTALSAFEGGARVFTRTWEFSFPRDQV
jgi:hypothetical protein